MSNQIRLPAQTAEPNKQGLVIIVDDDSIVRIGIASMLEHAGFATENYGSAEELMETGRAGNAACLLLDAHLPGLSGVGLLTQLSDSCNHVPVVMITGSANVEQAVRAMRAGAADFIEKPASEHEIVAAVERAVALKLGAMPLDALRLEAGRFTARLTRRQRQILQLIIDGTPNKIIAADLALSQRTVENHRAAIMQKAGTKSLPALTRLVFAASLPQQQRPTGKTARPRLTAVTAAAPAGRIGGEAFQRYFDQMPLAVVVSAIAVPERVIYANPAFEELTGQSRADLQGRAWSNLRGVSLSTEPATELGDAVITSSDRVGTFQIDRPDQSTATVDVFSNVIADDDDGQSYRLATLVDVGARDSAKLEEFEGLLRDKDTQLLEMQHRVKNNLQMITGLVRNEARNAHGRLETAPFDRLASRINSIQLVYKLLSEPGQGDEIDLGAYLSEVASSVMHASTDEDIRLVVKVDSFPVSVNVALPTGMVVNELLTNALKHAFVGRDGGTITLESRADLRGCRVVVADDGVGLPPAGSWPRQGKLSALIMQSLRQNAGADIMVESNPGKGTRVTIRFSRKAVAPITSREIIALGATAIRHRSVGHIGA